MSNQQHSPKSFLSIGALMISFMLVAACGGSGGYSSAAQEPAATDDPIVNDPVVNAVDITNAIFTRDSTDCADYANSYASSVLDITRSLGFGGAVTLSSDATSCALSSNNIPNHDFNDLTARFATQVSEVNRAFTIPRNPAIGGERHAAGSTDLGCGHA